MGLFTRNKTREQLSAANAVVLRDLAASCAVMKEMAKSDEVRRKLASLEEELTYSAPTSDPDVKKTESKIENKLGDLKILLTSKSDSPKVESLIEEIRLLIVERSAKC